MPWGVAAAATVGGAIISSDAARSAGNKQADAAQSAADRASNQFNTINSQQQPFREAGYTALNLLNNYLGVPTQAPAQNEANFDPDAYLAANPDVADKSKWVGTPWQHYQMYGQKEGRTFTGNSQYNQQLQQSQSGANTPGYGSLLHSFTNADLNANLAPNYSFMLDQGQRSTNNLNNATNGLISGNALQGLNTFTQNYAKNAYQDAYNNWQQQQNNIYSRLSGLAGLGAGSLNTTANAGISTTNSANDYLTGGAAAQAAGRIGQANAMSSGANSLSNYALLSSLFKGGGSSIGSQNTVDNQNFNYSNVA